MPIRYKVLLYLPAKHLDFEKIKKIKEEILQAYFFFWNDNEDIHLKSLPLMSSLKWQVTDILGIKQNHRWCFESQTPNDSNRKNELTNKIKNLYEVWKKLFKYLIGMFRSYY